MNMEELQDHAVHDYTIHNGIGIRVRGNRACRVIRLVKGQWIEIGNDYPLPVDPGALIWTRSGIPATVLAVALRVYELDHPSTALRRILTGKIEEKQPRYIRASRAACMPREFAAAK